MKKIYSSIAILMIAITGAFAQRHCDIAILPLIGPDSNSVYPCNDSVISGYYMINLGPDIIQSTDSFAIQDPNIDNLAQGLDPTDVANFYVYNAFPTGNVVNGYIGEDRAPTIDIGVGDTIIYYQWNDHITRLSTLVDADTPLIIVNGDTLLHYVLTATGSRPPDGNYYWTAHTLGFYGTGVVDTNGANNYRFSRISISCATSIKDTKFNNVALTVYPNPASNSVFFNYTFDKATSVTTRIMDLTGRTLKTLNLGKASPGNQKFEIDVNELPAGTYLLEFATSDSKGVAKFTKQ